MSRPDFFVAGASAGAGVHVEVDVLVPAPDWSQLDPAILIMLAALWQDPRAGIPVNDAKKAAFLQFIIDTEDLNCSDHDCLSLQYCSVACRSIEQLRGRELLEDDCIDDWLKDAGELVLLAGRSLEFVDRLFGEGWQGECLSKLDANLCSGFGRILNDRHPESFIVRLLPEVRYEVVARYSPHGYSLVHTAKTSGYSDQVVSVLAGIGNIREDYECRVNKSDPAVSQQFIKLLVIHELIDAELIQNASFTKGYRQEVHQLKTLLVESDDGLSALSKAELFVLEKLLQGVGAFDASIKERIYKQLWWLSIGFDPRSGAETLKAVNRLGYWGAELHLALGEGLSPGYIIWLIDCCGADIAVINCFNETPLMIAVSNGYHGKVLAKLICPHYINSADTILQQTALHAAVRAGSKECVKLLLDGGADIDLLTADGESALYLAVSAGNLFDIARLLLSRGAKVCFGCDYRLNALDCFIVDHKGEPLDILEALLQHMTKEKLNAPIVEAGQDDSSVLADAVSQRVEVYVIDALLAAGAELTPCVLESIRFDDLNDPGYVDDDRRVRGTIKRFIMAGVDPHEIINGKGESLYDLVSKEVEADDPLLLFMDSRPALGNFS